MGLRFRKSVTLCKGVRLNFGLHGMSVTTGTKGFHNTYNFGTGRTTTSIGIPGTGLSYVTTSGGRSNNSRARANNPVQRTPEFDGHAHEEYPTASLEPVSRDSREVTIPDDAFFVKEPPKPASILSTNRLKSIHYKADAIIDWTEMLIQDSPPPECNDEVFWAYCHERAYEVLNGNIDMYLQIIQDVGPLDDLLDYGFGFECGTDNPNLMVVEYQTREAQIMPARSKMNCRDYYDLLQDYICSCSIRIARDIFALLPVASVIVHAVSDGLTVLSVRFDRRVFMKMRLQGSDASDIVEQFQHNMKFDADTGLQPVLQLEG